MTSARFAFSFVILFGLASSAHAACGILDPNCTAGDVIKKATEDAAKAAEKASQDAGHAVEKGVHDTGHEVGKAVQDCCVGVGGVGGVVGQAESSKPLHPVRAYLTAKQIPPVAGAYGLVVFHSRPTSATRSKLLMVCKAFVAFFPRNETTTVPPKDQMITVWPLDNPYAQQAQNDDCEFAIDRYDLNASEAAISDAQLQHANFDGEGPYLVGWSPSKARSVPDALVLVMDMSADNSQAQINAKFLFWKNKIVEDPSAWRDGFSIERVRLAIHNFADQYGQAMLDAIKLIGDKKP